MLSKQRTNGKTVNKTHPMCAGYDFSLADKRKSHVPLLRVSVALQHINLRTVNN